MAMEAPPCELARARRPGVVARAQEDAPVALFINHIKNLTSPHTTALKISACGRRRLMLGEGAHVVVGPPFAHGSTRRRRSCRGARRRAACARRSGTSRAPSGRAAPRSFLPALVCVAVDRVVHTLSMASVTVGTPMRPGMPAARYTASKSFTVRPRWASSVMTHNLNLYAYEDLLLP